MIIVERSSLFLASFGAGSFREVLIIAETYATLCVFSLELCFAKQRFSWEVFSFSSFCVSWVKWECVIIAGRSFTLLLSPAADPLQNTSECMVIVERRATFLGMCPPRASNSEIICVFWRVLRCSSLSFEALCILLEMYWPPNSPCRAYFAHLCFDNFSAIWDSRPKDTLLKGALVRGLWLKLLDF